MKCIEVDALIIDFIYGTLESDVKGEIEKHLLQCQVCAQKVSEYNQVNNLFAQLPDKEFPSGLENKILGELAKKEHVRKKSLLESLKDLFTPRYAIGMGFASAAIISAFIFLAYPTIMNKTGPPFSYRIQNEEHRLLSQVPKPKGDCLKPAEPTDTVDDIEKKKICATEKSLKTAQNKKLYTAKEVVAGKLKSETIVSTKELVKKDKSLLSKAKARKKLTAPEPGIILSKKEPANIPIMDASQLPQASPGQIQQLSETKPANTFEDRSSGGGGKQFVFKTFAFSNGQSQSLERMENDMAAASASPTEMQRLSSESIRRKTTMARRSLAESSHLNMDQNTLKTAAYYFATQNYAAAYTIYSTIIYTGENAEERKNAWTGFKACVEQLKNYNEALRFIKKYEKKHPDKDLEIFNDVKDFVLSKKDIH